MSGEAEALLVVNQLRDLAADPMNRRAIVQDQGCLPGLILFLDHPNPQVVYSALLALRYLAECRANREKMEGELGMMLSLQNVKQKSTTPGETKLLASEVYELLQASSGPESDRAEGAPSGAGVGHCLYRSSDSPAGGEGREWPRDFDPLHGGRLSTGGAERGPAGLSARGGGPGRGARQGSDPGGQRAGWRYLARHRCQLPVSFLLLVTQWGLASPRSRT
ncbi:armadillo repeat-containing protein 1-like isoform X2 [Gadus chalcogrammus]|uniref:armadillo repeat-containing protein 1-like isoform X2 n=1 Tax=Gadus chalcogrammus TaxID=1042646 RepID=UPI0024C4751F|nr:armadillo repeat-containing protein 1-like isoform X2 [Gadus chalcogrammus]XP_056453684.1 armadillo repeat-containing protein 1-like isoform X2 [Gadus chalcogrammus]